MRLRLTGRLDPGFLILLVAVPSSVEPLVPAGLELLGDGMLVIDRGHQRMRETIRCLAVTTKPQRILRRIPMGLAADRDRSALRAARVERDERALNVVPPQVNVMLSGL